MPSFYFKESLFNWVTIFCVFFLSGFLSLYKFAWLSIYVSVSLFPYFSIDSLLLDNFFLLLVHEVKDVQIILYSIIYARETTGILRDCFSTTMPKNVTVWTNVNYIIRGRIFCTATETASSFGTWTARSTQTFTPR